jgi:hypothetical protein
MGRAGASADASLLRSGRTLRRSTLAYFGGADEWHVDYRIPIRNKDLARKCLAFPRLPFVTPACHSKEFRGLQKSTLDGLPTLPIRNVITRKALHHSYVPFVGRTDAPWRPRLACIGREDRSRKRFDASSPRRVGPPRDAAFRLRPLVDQTSISPTREAGRRNTLARRPLRFRFSCQQVCQVKK